MNLKPFPITELLQTIANAEEQKAADNIEEIQKFCRVAAGAKPVINRLIRELQAAAKTAKPKALADKLDNIAAQLTAHC